MCKVSPAGDDVLSGFRPRTTRHFRFGESTQSHCPWLCAPKTGVPSLNACLKGFSDGTSLCRRRTPGSMPGRFAPAFRLRTSLGLSKGANKNRRLTTNDSRLTVNDSGPITPHRVASDTGPARGLGHAQIPLCDPDEGCGLVYLL
jgi:hypothetical protein